MPATATSVHTARSATVAHVLGRGDIKTARLKMPVPAAITATNTPYHSAPTVWTWKRLTASAIEYAVTTAMATNRANCHDRIRMPKARDCVIVDMTYTSVGTLRP